MTRVFTRCTICGESFDIRATPYYFDESQPGQFAHADCVTQQLKEIHGKSFVYEMLETLFFPITLLRELFNPKGQKDHDKKNWRFDRHRFRAAAVGLLGHP